MENFKFEKIKETQIKSGVKNFFVNKKNIYIKDNEKKVLVFSQERLDVVAEFKFRDMNGLVELPDGRLIIAKEGKEKLFLIDKDTYENYDKVYAHKGNVGSLLIG